MRPLNGSLLLALALLAGSSPAGYCAQTPPPGDFPNKSIRWIIPFPPGGSNDMLSRFLGARLTDRLGQQLVIDNRAGANGAIGAEMVANAPPDGYTLLMISTSFVMNAAVRRLPYDVEKSFDPVSMIGSSPNSIVVNPDAGIGSLRELVDRARAKPGAINYAATGVGGFNHFGGELFKKVTGIDMVMVPYKGGAPAMIDVISGQVPVMFTSVTQVLPNVRSGRIRMLAVGAAKRVAALPDIPTVAESGFPGYEVYVWWGVSAPARTHRAALDKLRREFTGVLKEPETHKLLAADAAEIRIVTPAEFRTLIHDDVKKWTSVAKEAGIRVQ